MLTKDGLKSEFAKQWKKHYQIELFRQKGFIRKACLHCGTHFWTLDPDRKLCGSPPCENYGFIGRPITKVRWDYVTAWREFEKFFRKNGHAGIPRYPVIDRWRPDLYFTIASIQDFQRIDGGSVVMEYPADPLVVPQVCLRFNDIENVGVTGRHHTCFIMGGQHSFGKYWKDRTIELNFEFINRVMGVPEKEITYTEDCWSMPDFSQFGPSLETFSRGLELANSVFSQFSAAGSASGYKELPQKVVDVGWGHERLVWFTNGTTTGYDAVFEPVIGWMLKKTGLKETGIFSKYSVLAGSLTTDEVKDMAKMRAKVAASLGISVGELNGIVEPMQALFAIADHAKTLLFAVADGGIPSNVGGGYNLRVLLRRSLSFMEDHEFGFDLLDIAGLHTRQLKPLFPDLKEGLEPLARVLSVEKSRYRTTAQKAAGIVQKELARGKPGRKTLARLYTSNGIAPEDVQHMARERGIEVNVPDDFYTKITEEHMVNKKDVEERLKLKLDASRLPTTRRLYYEKPYQKDFSATIIKVIGDWVALDQTLFYPEGGGQPADKGAIDSDGKVFVVKDVQKIGDTVLHRIPGSGLKANQRVRGRIDWNHRYVLMKMHTATHVLAGVTRKIMGRHIWQAGAQKGLKSSRLDLTHYERFMPEDLERIEKEANRVIGAELKVTTKFYPRKDAESKYGFVLYQGGASPGKDVRVVSVRGLDVEACGGTHLANTKEIGKFKIIRAERIQDGINRIVFTTSDSAKEFSDTEMAIYAGTVKELSKVSKNTGHIKPAGNVSKEISGATLILSVEPSILRQTTEKFSSEIMENQDKIKELSEELGLAKKTEDPLPKKPMSLTQAVKAMFGFWKSQRKEIERMVNEKAKLRVQGLKAKAKNNLICEIVKADRRELIEMAAGLSSQDPRLTVILANRDGDVVGISKTEDMGKAVRDLCRKAGGSGGGKPGFAQGKADPAELVKIMTN